MSTGGINFSYPVENLVKQDFLNISKLMDRSEDIFGLEQIILPSYILQVNTCMVFGVIVY